MPPQFGLLSRSYNLLQPQTQPMSEFKFECPHCQQHMVCKVEFAGRQIKCPGCDHLINIPTPEGMTGQFQKESGMTWATHIPPPKQNS